MCLLVQDAAADGAWFRPSKLGGAPGAACTHLSHGVLSIVGYEEKSTIT
jgi:hypothetical protein